MKLGPPLTQDAAEGLAIQALTFIAGDAERLGRFLAVTGIGPNEIRAAARESGFLIGVLGSPGRRRTPARRLCRRGRHRSGRCRQGPRRARRRRRGSARSRELLPRLPRRRAGASQALSGLRFAAAGAPSRTRHADHRACGLRRVLRHDRKARRSFAHRQAGDRRRGKTRRGGGLLLCGPHLRHPLGDADVRGQAPLPRCRGDQAEHGQIREDRARGARRDVCA